MHIIIMFNKWRDSVAMYYSVVIFDCLDTDITHYFTVIAVVIAIVTKYRAKHSYKLTLELASKT